jgi:nitrogen fixation NifU-like protein
MTVHTDELYQQVILEHNRKPRNYAELEHPSHAAEGYNPLCGDHLKVYLQVSAAGVIEDLAFMGDGCAISKASASMMTAALKGKTIADARSLFEEFQKLVKKELDPEKDPHHLGKLTVFSGIWKYPARVKCATLAWHTMKGALENSKVVSTE